MNLKVRSSSPISFLLWPTLLTLPIVLLARWPGLLAPNEEPKWAAMILSGLLLLSGWIAHHLIQTGKAPAPSETTPFLRIPASGLWFIVFLVGLGIGTAYSINTGEALNRLSLWLVAALFLVTVADATRNNPKAIWALEAMLGLSGCLLASFFWYDYFTQFNDPAFNRLVFFSRIGHFNFTADVLVTLIPILSWILISTKSWAMRLLIGFSLASSSIMLLISGSLGGMGGILIGGLIALLTGVFSRFSATNSPKADREAAPHRLTAIALALIVAGGLFTVADKHMPENFRTSMFSRAEWWGAPKANDLLEAKKLPPLAPLWMAILPYLGARTPMWASTTGMIFERPLTGFGTGSFLFEYPGYSERYDFFSDHETLGTQIRTNPHNVFLQIASENGLPMALLFLGLFLTLTFRVMKAALQKRSAFWLCATWALWAMFLDAFVNHVFFNPASLLMAAMATGLFYGQLPTEKTALQLPLPKNRWGSSIFAALMLSLGFLLASYPLRWVVSEWYVSEAQRLSHMNPPASYRQILETWVSARKWSPTNGNALYGLANLTFQQGHLQNAERYLQAFLKLAPHHSAGLNLLANIEAKLGRLEEAEATYEKALSLDPSASMVRENLETVRAERKKSLEAQ